MELTKQNFVDTILSGVTLVDFWADWCGPCKAFSPIIEEIAGEYAGKITVGKVNTDDEPELSARYGIEAIPTVVLFRDGAEVRRFVGVQPKRLLEDAISAAIS
ncbi:MAG: thioredoxin [Oscillospiraceae bacterium]|jgi:thioredoxin 1|nr:thioredoxin [Oscillospiraceae bacterium]